MQCFNCKEAASEPINGILLQGKFYCSSCSTSNEELCVEETPDLVKGFLKGQSAVLKLLEEKHGLVDVGSAIDNFKSGRREGTSFGINEENQRCVEMIKSGLHSDAFGVCNCAECIARKNIIQEISLEFFEKAS